MVTSAQKKRDRKAAHLFKLVASPTRVSILVVIGKQKEIAVQDIADSLGMTHSAVSHQLSLLLDAGVVASRKDGRNMYYSISKSAEAKALTRFLASVS
jgi:ArsR family transcriptional regulator